MDPELWSKSWYNESSSGRDPFWNMAAIFFGSLLLWFACAKLLSKIYVVPEGTRIVRFHLFFKNLVLMTHFHSPRFMKTIPRFSSSSFWFMSQHCIPRSADPFKKDVKFCQGCMICNTSLARPYYLSHKSSSLRMGLVSFEIWAKYSCWKFIPQDISTLSWRKLNSKCAQYCFSRTRIVEESTLFLWSSSEVLWTVIHALTGSQKTKRVQNHPNWHNQGYLGPPTFSHKTLTRSLLPIQTTLTLCVSFSPLLPSDPFGVLPSHSIPLLCSRVASWC